LASDSSVTEVHATRVLFLGSKPPPIRFDEAIEPPAEQEAETGSAEDEIPF